MKAADFSQLLSVQMLMLAQGADGSSSFILFLQSSASNKCRPLSSSVCTQCSFTCSSCTGTHCCGGKRGQCLQAKRLALQLNGRLPESPSLHCNLKSVSAACLEAVICLRYLCLKTSPVRRRLPQTVVKQVHVRISLCTVVLAARIALSQMAVSSSHGPCRKTFVKEGRISIPPRTVLLSSTERRQTYQA